MSVVIRTAHYLKEVQAELGKVTWPDWPDLRKSTLVIVLFVTAIGALIGIMDRFFSFLLIDVMGRVFG